MKITVFLILLLLPKGNIKAEAVGSAQFPFFAQLEIIKSQDVAEGAATECGGTLISPRWILTAAHCFPRNPKAIQVVQKNRWVTVYMGNSKENAVLNKLIQILIHPRYYKYDGEGLVRLANDVALGRLEKVYNLTKHIQVIHLPMQNFPGDYVNICKVGTIVGMGKVYVQIEALNRSQLATPVGEPYADTVFYSEAAWTIKGDSGGPFICYKILGGERTAVQYGIRSISGASMVYEKVDQHMWFISYHAWDVKIFGTDSGWRVKNTKQVAEVYGMTAGVSFATPSFTYLCIIVVLAKRN